MSALKSLFKQTFIYGLATVLPRMMSFILVPLYTDPKVLSTAEYGRVSFIFAYFVLFNVVLAYGMETAFFRFFNKEENQKTVTSTSALSLIISSFSLLGIAFLCRTQISALINIEVTYLNLVFVILLLDALVIVPFAWLRATAKPMRYAILKILNVAINLGLNVFLLLFLKDLAEDYSLLNSIYKQDFEISYIFISNLIASAITLLLLLPFYYKLKFKFDAVLWKKMMQYAFPVLIAGIAYSVNETFDRILLEKLLPATIADEQVGMYSACYKLALFMTLFATAFRLGIEPYFFSHSKSENPQKNYAKILEYFVAFGAVILLTVVVFADVLKPFIIRSEAYYEAMWIVPFILLANFCLGIYHNLSVWYKITDRTKFGAYISIVGAIITLVLNYILIPIIGFKGAAIATFSAYAVMMILSFYFGKKYYPIPYNLKKILLYFGLSTLLSMLYFYQFRENYVIGIGAIIVFLTLVFQLEKKELKRIFINK
ncbi:oligosaccharide flippase family protein [Lacinutrix sp. C3R15]|uniref:oligosaccharide flippase family protein n=1 Tax=Flavobacteriaceae TaxID=49546 RepID=UPI001C08AFEA|nr:MULTISPECIES: oligosaccharide flippase family protein [Flavobacteriaceae]MBU2938091.1 oligosaccharide flippase family protein [Lacinutrix sp. C3R15]MDO6621405.1 oligosaccharide flippase family protein [Oceanihabitans sp. 1_MG-2023]